MLVASPSPVHSGRERSMAQPMYPPGPQGMMAPGMRPQQQPLMPPPKAGVSKVVPVMVSLLMAGGTFSGLYFGLGTGAETAEAYTAPAGGSGSAAAGSGSDTAGSG